MEEKLWWALAMVETTTSRNLSCSSGVQNRGCTGLPSAPTAGAFLPLFLAAAALLAGAPLPAFLLVLVLVLVLVPVLLPSLPPPLDALTLLDSFLLDVLRLLE